MKENSDLELSNFFWNSYKLFLDGKLSLNELKKTLTVPDDVVFYQRKCDPEFNVQIAIKAMMARELDIFMGELLTELESNPSRAEKKSAMQRILLRLLGFGDYPYNTRRRTELEISCDDIGIHFSSKLGKLPINKRLDEALHSLIKSMASATNFVKEEEIVEPILCKLVLVYSCLATSDREGAIKCKKLGKEIFTNIWFKSIPELVTLSYLKKMEHGSLPVSELELLEKYSF